MHETIDEIKIYICGAGGVGKSAITLFYCFGCFPEEYDPTIGEDYRKQISIGAMQFVVAIHDTAGAEEYSAMRYHHMRSSDAFLVVYSITDESSLAEAQTFASQIIAAKTEDDRMHTPVPMVFLGNKCDLEAERQVDSKEGESLAEKNNACAFFETSAKFGINVCESVETLAGEFVGLYLQGEDRNKQSRKQCVVS